MKTSVFFILLILWGSPPFIQENAVFKELAQSFQKNDAQSISSHFAETLDLSIESTEGTFGQKQASVVLKDFLNRNSVSSFKIRHSGSSNKNTQYSISEMKSGSKTWSVYVLINTDQKITQLQIEEE